MAEAPPDPDYLTVGEVAKLAHVSVRTLHHYDEIGLLPPARRTESGYRLYGPAELARLHQILLFRELGVALDTIGELVDQPPEGRRAALLAHRQGLEQRRRRTDAVIRAVDRAIDALEEGETMRSRELFEGFDAFDHAEHAEEAETRWGDTDAYRESQRRMNRYGKADWSAMKLEVEDIMTRWAALMESGADASDAAARGLAEEHRRHIDRWFYPCPPMMHVGLADMYEADPRFTRTFEKYAEGLAAFAADSIRANAWEGGGP